ncbi:helix-turn-helix transcriptional regulator [Streptomyces sp. NBC_01244]|uniref:helix-turn-helix transcriptional regulator n=1 Tax=Streptomyces sp. NBC_01244 TaxID=2903797 RepID=UPI002E12BF03|nr:LuxR C-terminal-related transcriptional regulator [Streptomyces sp. NBC_01244]
MAETAETGTVRCGSIRVALRASDAFLEHATGAYLQSCSRVNIVTQHGLPDADVSVMLMHSLNEDWLRVLRQDAARAVGAPVPVVVMADHVDERQLTTAVEYGLTSFLYRSSSSLEQLLDATIEASSGHSRIPDELVGHLISELGHQQRQQTLAQVSRRGGLATREIEVLRMLSEGMSTLEISEKMSYSERTIKGIVHDTVKQLNCKNRTQAVACAVRSGIL